MTTIEVPRKDWTRALDKFSVLHEGALVSLDVMGPRLGIQAQRRALPLRGVTAKFGARETAITISASLGNGEQFTHVIHSPTYVRIERSKDGVDMALEVDSVDGNAAILRFKTAAFAGG